MRIPLAIVALVLVPFRASLAQADHQDSALARLLSTYTEQLKRDPDSALATLRAVLGRRTASRQDSQNVATYALSAGNRFFMRGNVNPDLDTLSVAIAFASLSDSLKMTPEATFILGAAYLGRARMRGPIAVRSDSCGAWRAFRDDAVRGRYLLSLDVTKEVLPAWQNFNDPVVPESPLRDRADSILASRCAPPRPAGTPL
jgi:hypothetical protein